MKRNISFMFLESVACLGSTGLYGVQGGVVFFCFEVLFFEKESFKEHNPTHFPDTCTGRKTYFLQTQKYAIE